MRQEYADAVIEAGGVPVVMPPLMLRSQIDEWLDRIDADALMLTGGCDIDPQTFRETPVRGLGRVSLQRDVYELGLLEACMLRGMPVLGICRGLQVINVALGGSLYQDMLSQMGTEFARHQQKEPTEVATHEVAFIAGSMAENLFQTQFLPTNSHHHQCVHRVADDLTVSGTTVDGVVEAVTPKGDAPATVTKRIIQDMNKAYFPVKTIIPSTEIVHDRVMLELFRGCIRGCRFCQAGYVYRPVRNRSEKPLVEYAKEATEASGYEEMTLSSLSTSDYRPLVELCDDLEEFCAQRHVNLSLPSLRADNFSMALMERLQKGRKTGLTFAPEAGTQRLRDAINKNVREEDLLHSCQVAFEGGWNGVKLYFMLGLPTETDEDVLGIAELANQVLHTWRMHATNKARGVRITVSTSCFVPKPHSPFQWETQVTMDEYKRKVNLLRENIRAKNVTYNWHDPDTSFVEAVLSRGDRRIADVIEEVWRRGGKLEAWGDYFSFDRWMAAMDVCGVDPMFYACRERGKDEFLPWDIVDMGVRRAHLWHEREQAYKAELSPDCRKQCTGCGALALMTEGGKCDA